MIKTKSFSDLPQVEEVEIDIVFDYEYKPATSCSPDETYCDFHPRSHWEELVFGAYLNAARRAVKQIESEIEEITPEELKKWDEEARAERYKY